MTRVASILRALALAVICLAANAASAAPVEPRLYGGLPTVSEAALSPDGNAVAQIQSVDNIRSLAIYDLTGEKSPIGMELGSVKARDAFWVNDKYVLLLVSSSYMLKSGRGNKPIEIWRWLAIDRLAKKKTYLFKSTYQYWFFYGSGDIISTLPSDPDSLLLGQHYDGYSLFKVGLDKEREKLLHRGHTSYSFGKGAGTVDWVVDAQGAPVVRVDFDSKERERRFFVPANTPSNWRLASTIAETNADDVKVSLISPAESETVIHATSEHEGQQALYAFDVESAAFVRREVFVDSFDISSVVTDHQAGKVVGARYVDNMMRTVFIDPALREAQAKIERAIPNSAPIIESWSDDKTKFLIRVRYTDHPDQIFFFDTTEKTLSMLTPTYAALDGKIAARKEHFEYRSSDGITINGYLTVPAGAKKENMPLIVLPHGGPFARDDQSFDWWSFFYAARGYLVYQPNFRGSTGYGAAFKEAGHGQWGRKMQDDVTQGVEKLIADGVVDPARICIVGASYGGYAALAGATLTPELYSCAVSVSGISNLMQLLADNGGRDGDDDYWTRRVGSRFSDNDKLREVSPLYNVDAVQSPILLIHSEDDIVVPVGQSRRMRNALRDAGKEHKFVVLKGEDHWLSSGETRTEMLKQSIEFIDQHIGQ